MTKFLKFILKFLFFSIVVSKRFDKPLNDVISELFIKPNIPFNVIIYKSTIFDQIDRIGTHIHGKIIRTSKDLQLSQSAVIFTQNTKEVMNKIELTNNFYKPLKFLICTSEVIKFENLSVPKLTFDRGHIGHFSYFLTETSKEIKLTTLEWFTDQGCNNQQSILINTFSKSSNKWVKHLKIDEKFKNFHNCTFKVFSWIYRFNILNFLYAYDKIKQIRPFEIKIVEAIAGKSNFTPEYRWEPPQPQDYQYLQAYYLPRISIPDDECFVGSVFWEDYVAFSTTPAESYTSYEKMLFPFDKFTWSCILGTFACAFVTIFIVSRMTKDVQNLVFGEKVNSPVVNVVGLFFGIGQNVVPKNSFARFILMMYILYCVVINTAYHGVFFEMMTTDMKKPLPKTVADLQRMKFEPHVCIFDSNDSKVVQGVVKDIPNIITFSYNFFQYAQLWLRLRVPSEKVAYLDNRIGFVANRAMFKNPPIMMKEKLQKFLYDVSLMRNNFLYNVTETIMSGLVEGGIPQYFLTFIEDVVLREKPSDPIEPKTFGIEDLEFGFIIFLVACGISIVAFLMEVIYFYLRK